MGQSFEKIGLLFIFTSGHTGSIKNRRDLLCRDPLFAQKRFLKICCSSQKSLFRNYCFVTTFSFFAKLNNWKLGTSEEIFMHQKCFSNRINDTRKLPIGDRYKWGQQMAFKFCQKYFFKQIPQSCPNGFNWGHPCSWTPAQPTACRPPTCSLLTTSGRN